MSVPLFVFSNERKHKYKQRKILEQISEAEIRTHCGLPWWGVREIVELFSELQGKIATAIPVETKVLTLLSLLRSGTFQWTVGSLAGISQSSSSRIIEATSNILLKTVNEHIAFPTSQANLINIKKGFHSIANFPNIVGVIDGTHVAIKAPTNNEAAYVNRKQFHSINVQVVADDQHQFTDIVAKWPGSTHDSFMWSNSGLKHTINRTLDSGWLLGDSGYPLQSILLTPYPNSATDPVELAYNKAHTKTRCVIERTIGHWKARFRILSRSGGYLSYREGKTCKLIVCTAILHNICKRYRIPLLPEDELFDIETSNDLVPYQNSPQIGHTNPAIQTRRRIAERLYSLNDGQRHEEEDDYNEMS